MRNPLLLKRTLRLYDDGGTSSVALEREFWDGLEACAHERGLTWRELVIVVNNDRFAGTLVSVLRVYVLDYYRSRSSGDGSECAPASAADDEAKGAARPPAQARGAARKAGHSPRVR